ncbi:globoside alpha-1,3-N-acetylgalactosaminyltransferase 1 [Zootoca vivipara]|uniref:globoside alpha-1,3-N-acetylgalactosaminyltransferase 1 n=1 Tax=Zootoca vivipara TaxID=8524 RepID=UPI001590FE9F|nr:globoside alpha-1,3-N-acetylgalactosaminyltransferase 1 [Zootoca vivipara]XP_034968467.1 globoside alpha-1,3-N-acetylgalactosaminyltransferase 1 [Zootoca vivipara]XP_034968468.1 globoside alpha-1,3-N-acetylgalactosaminyltransferase 1 [Zootoca vivipara]XP_034968469.1 globoside alpha-1,3-N-acetylgalactosaminyltransferase 1 [Zootoca vivipara]XP_034968470.1 globoside alpha-1,3-N-acetylgalactosaminyltransferase 1 [Zootoca vivipara]XP_034968471.1 globoside alpha-1,3-N-acetylgalactosaminyltransfer
MKLQKLVLSVLALTFSTISLFIGVLIGKGPNHYLPYYLPCPDLFALKLQYREENSHQLFPQFFYPQPESVQQTRSDVLTVTPWLAPIVWEGTFSPEILDSIYKPLNLTIGLTAFVVGKYIRFASRFLESAEQYFMVGYNVNYYIFTDNPKDLSVVHLQPGRTLHLIPIKKHAHWQEISMRRMEIISRHISDTAHREVDYLFCLDIDMLFQNPWGPETLGEMVAVIHPGYYKVSRRAFPYERRTASMAYISQEEGDFYYGGAAFGGLVKNVYEFTRACHMAILADKANGIVAAWQEESHLNRHFLSRKPSKLLSPEYLWDDTKSKPPELRLIRVSSVSKNYREVRD